MGCRTRRRFSSVRSVLPILLAMLNDPKEEPYWSNIVITLCIIGDASAAKSVIDFIEKDPAGNLSARYYTAKSSAVMALGYLINRMGSREALDYLKRSLDPKAWSERKIDWKATFQDSTTQRDTQLSTMAVLGLALSGHREAGDALRGLRRRPPSPAAEAFAAEAADTVSESLSTAPH